ncbi:FAD-dependent oxidoreductase [Paraburkholderia sacchari]|uniref:FAD-dependent oxidoreductase n=1 Tax=Paraburkholderia sacchari TaxID=159450 RepID=UPI00054224C7|nr:FAD-dependent oxidoreductase [Paraburkholderia sacchari]NLP63256.1 FAD-dependent oxidoreductase [Paraburkholderia sacchari]
MDTLPPADQRANHAIVIGASVAGCLTAAVLARRFQHVTLVEKGDFYDESAPRRSLPQEHHVHLLLSRGKQVIERIFPGFLAELETHGAEVADLGHDVKWYQGGLWKNRYRSGIRAHYCSRRLIDNLLRRRITREARIQVLSGARVESCEFDDSDSDRKITGVLVDDGGGRRRLPAQFVVDASGRGTRLPDWLEQAQFGTVERTVVQTDLGYASRIYRRMPEFASNWRVLLVLPEAPAQRSMGVISPIEDDRWLVTTGGWFGNFPGSDPDEFLEALANLPVPDIYDVVKRAQPLSDISTFRMPGSQRRHYERLPTWPRGLLAVGDALTSMNPLYSQGMTLCALEAECIDIHVDAALRGELSYQSLQRQLSDVVESAWQMATTEDQRFPETRGKRSVSIRFHHWYGARLARVSGYNRRALETQIGVANLVVDPDRLFAPGIVARVLRESVFSTKGR